MKKYFILLLAITSTSVFAAHHYNICYYNWSSSPVTYNNDGVSHSWKLKGSLKGTGTIAPKQNKCFNNVVDETLFTTHYITFYVNNKWLGVTNPGFAKPYAIAEGANATSGGKLYQVIDNAGQDNYILNVHILKNKSILLSGSNDPQDLDSVITPRKLK